MKNIVLIFLILLIISPSFVIIFKGEDHPLQYFVHVEFAHDKNEKVIIQDKDCGHGIYLSTKGLYTVQWVDKETNQVVKTIENYSPKNRKSNDY